MPQVVGALPGQLQPEVGVHRQGQEGGATARGLQIGRPRLHPRRDRRRDPLANLQRFRIDLAQFRQRPIVMPPRQQGRQVARAVGQQQFLIAPRQAAGLAGGAHHGAVPAQPGREAQGGVQHSLLHAVRPVSGGRVIRQVWRIGHGASISPSGGRFEA